MPLTEEEKAERKRQRMIEKAREWSTGTHKNKVASDFQKMIRAEAGADTRQYVTAIVDGEIRQVKREVGQCVCVTCGTVGPWKSSKWGSSNSIETGHFLAGRSQSILFEETNAHPQCVHCNRDLSGNQGVYEMWMRFIYGQEEIDRLRRLKNEPKSFTREQLVDMRISFGERLKAAEERMANG